MFNYDDYIEDILIDPEELDMEWLEQPQLFARYGKISVEMKRDTADAEEEVKTIRSELVKEVKEEEPSSTMQEVEAFYRTHKRYKKAKSHYFRLHRFKEYSN